MNLFDVLSKDERVIVLSCVEDKCIYTWNQSLTLQCWEVYSNQGGKEEHDSDIFQLDGWNEVGIMYLPSDPINFKDARKTAQKWHNGG